MKHYIIIFFVFSTMLACSSLPPDKKFTTETFIIPPGTCIYKCITWSNETNICGEEGIKPCCIEAKVICPGEIDYPPNPIVIDMGNPAGSAIGGLINEIDYQEFLKKSCLKWR